MKKKIVFAFICCVLIVSTLSSCLPGVAVSLVEIDNNNTPRSVLLKYPGYTETISYYVEDKASYTYSIYIENADHEKGINVCEKHSDSILYAYEGELYMMSNSKLFAILQASGTYAEYVERYMTFKSVFDECTYYQTYSKKITRNGKEVTEVCYEADPSNEVLAQASSLGIKPGDKLVSVYFIDNSTNLVEEVDYYYKSQTKDNQQSLFMKREFLYLSNKKEVFSILPTLDNTFSVNIVYNPGKEIESTSHYSIPKGCAIGIDTNGKNISFFEDAECTVPFNFNTYSASGKDEVFIYALYN